MRSLERLSIEVTGVCSKACAFCYNASGPNSSSAWDAADLVAFVRDCAGNGVRAVSFGGGEPLQYPALESVLQALRGSLFRSITTNGLLLDPPWIRRLVRCEIEKVHVSVHYPEREREVRRVIASVHELQAAGIRSGVNLLVRRSELDAAKAASRTVQAEGIGIDRIVFLPMRGQDTPTPAEVGAVAGEPRFQSMSCLTKCGRSPRFAAISHGRNVAWCSYTAERAPLERLDFVGLQEALARLGVTPCWESARVPVA